MDFNAKLDQARTLADVFELVKRAVEAVLGRTRAGLMLALADLGNHPQGFLGAFYPVASNVIVMNKVPSFEFRRRTRGSTSPTRSTFSCTSTCTRSASWTSGCVASRRTGSSRRCSESTISSRRSPPIPHGSSRTLSSRTPRGSRRSWPSSSSPASTGARRRTSGETASRAAPNKLQIDGAATPPGEAGDAGRRVAEGSRGIHRGLYADFHRRGSDYLHGRDGPPSHRPRPRTRDRRHGVRPRAPLGRAFQSGRHPRRPRRSANLPAVGAPLLGLAIARRDRRGRRPPRRVSGCGVADVPPRHSGPRTGGWLGDGGSRRGHPDVLPGLRRLRHGDRSERLVQRGGRPGDWADHLARHHDGWTLDGRRHESRSVVRAGHRRAVLRQLVRVLDRAVHRRNRRGPVVRQRVPREASMNAPRSLRVTVTRAVSHYARNV